MLIICPVAAMVTCIDRRVPLDNVGAKLDTSCLTSQDRRHFASCSEKYIIYSDIRG